MPRPIHFEIHAEQPERAEQFYRGLFGWEFTSWGGGDYWLIKTGEGEPGIDGGMIKRMGGPPADGQAVNAYVCTVGVDNLDQTMTKALGAGATLAVPKMAVPGIGWLGYLKDTEGNIFGVIQNDPAAR